MLNVFIIAGEKSGDDIAAKLMTALIKKNNVHFQGIGGEAMKAQGLNSLFSIDEISVMGFSEVIPKLFSLISLINYTINKIIETKPDIIITVDSPGFNYRVVSKLRAKGYKGTIIHYIAPSVWAYKEKRAQDFARIFDHMICILPFEPPFFKKAKMKVSYVGNPVIEHKQILKKRKEGKLKKILLCPGSRNQEIKTLLPIFANAIEQIAQTNNIRVMILANSDKICFINQLLANAKFDYKIISSNKEDKLQNISKCDLAITKSGTITTEIALAKVPMILAHKVNYFSYLIIKAMIKIPYICLINIIANKSIIPELIQQHCNAQRIAELVDEYLENPKLRNDQINQSSKIFKCLGLGLAQTPSEIAADIILSYTS
jgi:lipid-A-disaccharide synthase